MDRRTRLVWVSFVGGMTALVGLLSLGDGRLRSNYMAASASVYNADAPAADDSRDPLFNLDAPLDTERWDSIVIHHLGRPSGDVDTVDRLHRAAGIDGGIGYHFLIGNGNGLDEGVISITDRWKQQAPAVALGGSAGAWHNEHAISICLVGNGDRRAFEPRQIESLILLIRRLQDECGISAERVLPANRIAGDSGEGPSSPGRYFPVATLDEALRR